MNVVALVTAEGHRAGETTALSPIRGETLLTHAVRGLLDSGYVDLVVVVAPAVDVVSSEETLRPLAGQRWQVLGAESLRVAFEAIEPSRFDIFLVHDARRAFTPPSLVRTVIKAIHAGAPAVVPVLPISDTVKLVDANGVIIGTQDRERLRTAQTPLGFTGDALASALASGGSDLFAGEFHTVGGHPNAMLVATAFDVKLAEAAVAANQHEESL